MQQYYIILLPILSMAIISPAEYVYDEHRPLIAAHRGLCSLFPENTIPSFQSAMYMSTDFIELDVVLNKNDELIVAHDTYMSTVSNILELPQFEDKLKLRVLNGNEMENFWIIDFTIDELRQVGINQIRGQMRSTMFDQQFTYPTLREVLNQVNDFNQQTLTSRNPDSKLVGILLEIKDYEFHLKYSKKDIVEAVIEELTKFGVGTISQSTTKIPIVLMSFDENAVKKCSQLTNLPRVQLAKQLQDKSETYIKEVSAYANILGADLNSLWDPSTQAPFKEVEQIKNSAMLVYGWTFQDDVKSQLKMFNSTNSQEMYRKAIQELKLNGIITEFSDAAMAYAQAYKIN